jgi:hypothetical protein
MSNRGIELMRGRFIRPTRAWHSKTQWKTEGGRLHADLIVKFPDGKQILIDACRISIFGPADFYGLDPP